MKLYIASISCSAPAPSWLPAGGKPGVFASGGRLLRQRGAYQGGRSFSVRRRGCLRGGENGAQLRRLVATQRIQLAKDQSSLPILTVSATVNQLAPSPVRLRP
jgi:hypothetical protein